MTSSPATNQPVPNSNLAAPNDSLPVPASVKEIMATNAQVNSGAGATGLPVVVKSYKPSGRVGPLAWPIMLMFALASGVLVGTIYHFVAPSFSTLLFTQLLLGAALAVPMYLGATLSKLRSANFGVAFGVLATLVLYATFHTWGAWQMREDVLGMFSTQLARASGGKATPSQVRARLGRRFTLPRAIELYWKDRYQSGVTLRDEDTSKVGSSTAGTSIAGPAYVGLLVCEIGLTALIAAIGAGAVATRRFSEEGNRFYSRKRVFGLSRSGLAPTIRAFQAGDWDKGAQYGIQKIKQENPATVFASTVPGAQTGWLEVVYSANKETKLLFEKEVPIEALRTLGAKV